MKFLSIVLFLGVLTGSLLAETKYSCHIKKVFDANSLRVYDATGIKSIDTMLLSLQDGLLSHQVKEKSIQYIKQGSGVTRTRNLQQSSFVDVPYSEYRSKHDLPMTIYALHDFQRVIRIDFDQTYTYDCVEIKK